MSIQQNNEQRIARLEAVCNQLRSQMYEVLRNAYKQAVEEHDEDRAAELARKIRNELLDKTDSQMSLDRLHLDASSAATFLASLKNIMGDDWAVYRQALRDLPEQEGFPFDITFPTPPGKLNENAEDGETNG